MISSERFQEVCFRGLIGPADPQDVTWSDPFSCEVVLENVTVSLSYDYSRSRELTFGLRRDAQSDPAFEIADVLRVTTCPPAEYDKLALIQSGDPVVLERFLNAAWEALTRYGDEFLRGSDDAFDRARTVRSQRALEFTERVNDAPSLRAADDAWHRKDLTSVAQLLGPLRTRLGERDNRRLAYALRTIAESQGA